MTNELRPGLPPLPPKMSRLYIDKRGFPVPFFVAMINGEPDHRIVEPRAVKVCVEQSRCWICGGPLGVHKSFTVGPMCAINRISAEPPAHRECARYAATTCPFLARPHMKRREAGMPEQRQAPAGGFLMRNPGVSLVWTTRSYKPFRTAHGGDGRGGVLFDMGPADSLEWYSEGRPATRAEIDESITTGLPKLVEVAQADDDDVGLAEIRRRTDELNAILDRQFAGA